MLHAPGQHPRGQRQPVLAVGRIVGAVDELVGVALEIEEQRRQGGEMDIFQPPGPQDVERALVAVEPQRPFDALPDDVAEVVFPVDLLAPVGRRVARQERP